MGTFKRSLERQKMNLLIFGCPGVGKGTQAELLAASLDIPHHATGDILREAVTEQTEAGKIAKECMKQGELVPDEILSDIVQDVIHNADNFILDGYPRNKQQVKFFFEIMRIESRQLTKVLHLIADEDIVITRMLNRGRTNETEDMIRKRLAVYKTETLPILEMFPPDKLLTIESVGDKEIVNEEILSLLNN